MKAALKYPGIQYQPDHGKNRGWLFQTIRQILRTQFGRPAGLLGHIAGKIMAFTPSNKDRIHWTISLLDIKPDDRLLEIGFGPGYAIEIVSKMVPKGFIAGIDHSEVMVRHAAKRNARAIREGKVAQMSSAIQTSAGVGMQTLDQCLLELVQKRLITRDTAREKAKNPDDF